MIRFLSIFILCLLFAAPSAVAQKRWSFEIHGGGVVNAKLPLIIKQTGYEEIRIQKALFMSEPLKSPYYWVWRVSKWMNYGCFEFEAIHHKLYLINKPTEVKRFGISHGFNMLFLNVGKKTKWFIVRTGLGSVLLHPESTIRGFKFSEGPGFDVYGYFLRGITTHVAIARQIRVSNRFYLTCEGKITYSYVTVPIVIGNARLHNLAFQFIMGPGTNFFTGK